MREINLEYQPAIPNEGVNALIRGEKCAVCGWPLADALTYKVLTIVHRKQYRGDSEKRMSFLFFHSECPENMEIVK